MKVLFVHQNFPRTPPVEEVIQDGVNGLLVDIFAPDQIAERVIEALGDRTAHDDVRQNARQTVIDRYDLHRLCLPTQLRLLGSLLPRRQQLHAVGSATKAEAMQEAGRA